eukprot:7694670-Prorocentrum_lima.AAC.1
MVVPSLGMMPATLHIQGSLNASMIFFTIEVYPNMITSSTCTMKKPSTSSLRLGTTFHTFLK